MKNLTTNIGNVTIEELNNIVAIENEVNFLDLITLPSGHGHRKVFLKLEVDGKEIELIKTTSCMPLIDAYNDQVNGDEWDEDYENPTLSLIELCYNEEIIEEKLED